jgi:hypothetical protein
MKKCKKKKSYGLKSTAYVSDEDISLPEMKPILNIPTEEIYMRLLEMGYTEEQIVPIRNHGKLFGYAVLGINHFD